VVRTLFRVIISIQRPTSVHIIQHLPVRCICAVRLRVLVRYGSLTSPCCCCRIETLEEHQKVERLQKETVSFPSSPPVQMQMTGRPLGIVELAAQGMGQC